MELAARTEKARGAMADMAMKERRDKVFGVMAASYRRMGFGIGEISSVAM